MPRGIRGSTKLERAIAIRDAARDIVAREGKWEEVGIGGGKRIRVRSASFERIKIVYTTPFQPIPEMSSTMKWQCALHGYDTKRHAYWIDIWDSWKKVFFVLWNDDEGLTVSSFRRGDWEERVLGRAEDGRGQASCEP